MKKILLLLAIITIFSCSSDSDSGSNKLVTKITTTSPVNGFNEVYNFTYDTKNRVSNIIKTGDVTASYLFHYDKNGNADLVTVTDANGTNDVVFTYDGKILNSYKYQDTTTPVSYDNATKTYTIGTTNLMLNQIGDLSIVNMLEIQYESGKKGAFRNERSNFQLVTVFIDGMFLFVGTNGVPKAIVATEDDSAVYSFDNAYDDADYVKSLAVAGIGDNTINFSATFEYAQE